MAERPARRARRERPLSLAQLEQVRAIGEGRGYSHYCRGRSEHGAAAQVFQSLVRRGLVVDREELRDAALALGDRFANRFLYASLELTDAGVAVYRARWGLPPGLLAARHAAYAMGGLSAVLAVLPVAERGDWLDRSLGRAALLGSHAADPKKRTFTADDFEAGIRGVLIEEGIVSGFGVLGDRFRVEAEALLASLPDVELGPVFYRRKDPLDGR